MMEDAAAQLERDHVHSVYDQIAPYFNDIRYKAWPKVRQFLLDQPPGSLVADVGCGNGKYLNINKEVFKLGCDVCRPLVDFAWSQGHEVQMCDGLHLPYRDGCFDAVLSIAVIHHLSTKERRIRAIKEMARALRVGGRIMIYVWAMEQKRRKFEKQDIFVPWNPNPLSPPHGGPRARAGAQSAGDPAADHADKHRKVKSTSSVMDGDGLRGACAGPQQKSQRLWFFSRSLDSVFDFGSLAISRSSSRDLSSLSSRSGEQEGGAGRWYRGRGLIKQVSSFFSAAGSEEDVFESRQKEAGDENARAGPKKRGVPPAMVQGFGSEALPDLVPSQKECAKAPGDGGEGGDPEVKWGERRGSRESPEEGERPPMGPCLRYYHVFREGELAELIDRHVEELHVTNSYFDHANWCVVAEKIQVWKI